MHKKKEELRAFILSGDKFLTNYLEFDKLLSEWSDTLMTLVEAIGRTFAAEGQFGLSGLSISDQVNGNYAKYGDSELNLPKAVVIVAGIAGSVLIVFFTKGSWTVGAAMIGGVFVVAFFDKISNALKRYFEKKPEKPAGLNSLSNKISESLSWMRNQHVKCCYRLKFKNPDPQRVARHDPQEDRALFDYKEHVLQTLPRMCINRVDDIGVECDGEAFRRKTILYDHWRSTSQQPSQGKPN